MQVELEPDRITASPGEETPCRITVTNTSDREVSATLRVLGVPTDAAGFSTLRVGAGERTTLTIQVLMPIGSPGGTHPFQIELITEAGRSSMARGEVLVPDAGKIHLALSPSGVSGNWKGRLLVSIHNRSSQPTELSLSGEGDEHRVRFRFRDRTFVVNPGERVNVPTKVRSRRPAAGDAVTRRFTVRAHGAAIPLRARGTFRQTPVFDRSLSKILAVLVVLSLWAGAVGVGLAVVSNRQDLLAAIGLGDDEADASGGDTNDGVGGGIGDGTGPGDGTGDDGDGDDGDELAATPAAPGGAPRVTGFVRDPDGNAVPSVAVAVSPASLGTRSSTIAVESSFQTLRGKRLGPIAPDLRPSVRALAVTGGDGSYTTPISSPGAYYLDFRAPGFQTAKHLTVFGSDMEPIGLDVTLQRATGGLTGGVSPPVAARILVTDGVARYETTADAGTGRWELDAVSVPGEYVVQATLPTGESQTIVASVPASSAGSMTDVGTIRISSGLTSLSGIVCDASTAALDGVPGATVTVETADADTSFTTTTADAVTSEGVLDEGGVEGAGRWAVNGIPILDSYDVTVVADGFVTVSRRYGTAGFQSDCIELTASTGGLTGTVAFDEPGPNTSGIAVRATSATNQYVTTVGEQGPDGRGAFTIGGMAPGDYVVTVTRPDVGTVVRQIRITPPDITEIEIEVEQVDTDASLSTPVRFLLEGENRSFRSAAPGEALADLTLVIAGVELDGALTDAVTDEGTIDEIVQLPLGRHRLVITAAEHETVRLPVVVLSADDEYTVDLAGIDRPGSDPAALFDGELRPLATLATAFVSGLDDSAIEGLATLQKVVSDISLDPARGLEEYGEVDEGTTNTITMTTPAETFSLDRRLPSGSYVLTDIGEAPDFHWTADVEERFDVDLRTTSVDGTQPVGPEQIVFPRFPLFDITITSSTDVAVLDSAEKVVRTIGPAPTDGGVALCADGTLPTASGSDPELLETTALTTVVYDDLPAVAADAITIAERSVEIDRDNPETAHIVVCRDELEPVLVSSAPLAPNDDLDIAAVLNPATVVEVYWDDHGTDRIDFTDDVTAELDGIPLLPAGDGRFQSGKFAPGEQHSPLALDVSAYPGYLPPDLTAVTVEGGATTRVELPTSDVALAIPVFQTAGASFDELVVTLTSVEDATVELVADQQQDCVNLGGTPATVTQCDFVVGTTPSGITDLGNGTYVFGGITYSFLSLPATFFLGGSQLTVDIFGDLAHVPFGGTELPDGSLVLRSGQILPGDDVEILIDPSVSIPRGRYAIEITSDGEERALFAANDGTLDITPDKGTSVRLGDALQAVRRVALAVDVVDQVGAQLPLATEDPLPVTVTQDGFAQAVDKTAPAALSFLVDPIDLVDQLAVFSTVVPANDPTGANEVTLTASDITPVAPGPITVAVDLTGDERFTFVDPADGIATVTSTVGSPAVQIQLLRYSTLAIKVTGDLRQTASDNPLLAGAAVGVTFTDPALADFDGIIGEYSSAYDTDTDTITWSPLTLVGGTATLTTLELGSVDANLRFRKLRVPGCPTACTASIDFSATHPDFQDTATSSVALVQGTSPATVGLVLADPVLRQVSGTFRTTEDRALVNTAVCVTATPTSGAKPGTPVEETFSYGYGRGTQSWTLDLVPRTKYTITAVARDCAEALPAGNYTPVGTGIEISSKAGEPGQGSGSGPVTGLAIQFQAGGASVSGTVRALYPGADATDARVFTGCGSACPLVELFAASDTGFANPIASGRAEATTGAFTLTDASGSRVLPLEETSGGTTTFTDRAYVLRISSDDIETTVHPIGTLVENQPTVLDETTYPLVNELRAHAVDLTAESVGGQSLAGVDLTFDRTDVDALSTFVPVLECTTGATCAGFLLVPGTYTVTGPAGSTVLAVGGDDGDPGDALVLDRPAPEVGDRVARAVTVTLGFDIAITVTDGVGTPVNDARVVLTKSGQPDLDCTTGTAGTCTIEDADTGAHAVSVDALVVSAGATYDVLPAVSNSHTIQVESPTMTFLGNEDGATVFVSGSTATCGIVSGSCTLQLDAIVTAGQALTATATRDTRVSTTTFQWGQSRTVTLAQLAPRTRTITVTDGVTPIEEATVTLTPGAGVDGGVESCTTTGTGSCTVSGLGTGSYTIAVAGFAQVVPASTTITVDATGSVAIDVAAPTITFTGMDGGTTILLSDGSPGCTVAQSGSSCTTVLDATTPATVVVTATATRTQGGTTSTSTTTFRWATTRSVDINTLIAP